VVRKKTYSNKSNAEGKRFRAIKKSYISKAKIVMASPAVEKNNNNVLINKKRS
jgi:hypothetical protein